MPANDNIVEWPAGDTAARVLGASQYHHGPIAGFLLRSLAIPYRCGVWLHNAAFDLGIRRARAAGFPVISVGNIVAGGAGKTPFTRWLAQQLTDRGRRVAILHGGYGSDEPGLHRKWQPAAIVIEQKDRIEAAAAATSQGADVIILDDAFQHRRLARDADIVLMPVEIASARLLPGGPLREPESALARADLVVVTRKTAPADAAIRMAARIRRDYGTSVAVAAILPAGFRNGGELRPAPASGVVAVASIARPDLLLQQLRAEGVTVTRMLAYPDHYYYGVKDRDQIREAAGGRPIVTTEKDAIKLTAYFKANDLWVLEQQVLIEAGADQITSLIDRVL